MGLLLNNLLKRGGDGTKGGQMASGVLAFLLTELSNAQIAGSTKSDTQINIKIIGCCKIS